MRPEHRAKISAGEMGKMKAERHAVILCIVVGVEMGSGNGGRGKKETGEVGQRGQRLPTVASCHVLPLRQYQWQLLRAMHLWC